MTAPPAEWTAIHLTYGSIEERRHLIVEQLAPLAGNVRWFFADGVATDELELAVHGPPDALIATAPTQVSVDPHPPCVLQVVGGDGDAIRGPYATILALDTARAVARLTGLSSVPADDAIEDLIAHDLAAMYAAAAPDTGERLTMLRDHAAWLARVENRSGRSSLGLESPPIEVSFPASPDPALVGASADLRLAAAGRADAASFTALTARLAHTQVVRLRGPRGREQLAQERRLIELLADKLATSST